MRACIHELATLVSISLFVAMLLCWVAILS